MRKNLPFTIPLLGALMWGADVCSQCPLILNCPQGSPVVCDISGNDPFLWNDAPHTFSQVLDTVDLYEGSTDFSIKVLPCVGGGNVQISYVLLLDLDNDNLRETAVQSTNLPPIGIVYANNAFNPGYSGGEPVEFDKRQVQDSLKFRFAMEVTSSWDTLIAHFRWQSGGQYVSPRLPEGRHYLIWRVQQDGVVKNCEYSFRIKDCQPPALECAPAWGISLDLSASATLFLNDVLPNIADNTTPFPLMELSMRKPGNGQGFPLDSSGNTITSLTYDCEELDTQSVELWAKDRHGNSGYCTTLLTVTDDGGACEKPHLLCARPYWNSEDVVEPVTFKMKWVVTVDTTQQLVVLTLPPKPGGCSEMNVVPPANTFTLTAECDSSPLNGVSTFDLLLISKHILGVQPFDTPWKWIAADANKNGSITTFDLVELRKLILGIYTKLPSNTSWRFFPTDCVFPDNPFNAYCPSEYAFVSMQLWQYPDEITFNALKTGDVNGSANPVSLSADDAAEIRAEPVHLELPGEVFQAGETYDIPLRAGEPGEWAGFQFGLRFDPETIRLESVEPGKIQDMDEHAFAQPEYNLLNVSWFTPASQSVAPGEILMTIRAKALRDTRLKDAIRFDDSRLDAEVYTETEGARPLQLRFGAQANKIPETAVWKAQPNPTNAGIVIPLRLPLPERVRVEISDVSGKSLWLNELFLEDGAQMLEIPASVFPDAGIYVWRILAGEAVQSGKIVRL